MTDKEPQPGQQFPQIAQQLKQRPTQLPQQMKQQPTQLPQTLSQTTDPETPEA